MSKFWYFSIHPSPVVFLNLQPSTDNGIIYTLLMTDDNVEQSYTMGTVIFSSPQSHESLKTLIDNETVTLIPYEESNVAESVEFLKNVKSVSIIEWGEIPN